MAEIEKLNQRVAALQQQVVTLKAELGDTNAKLDGANARLGKATADLDAANAKIASLECKVDRLGDERSAFFTQLKTILAGHDGISVVGDRFVFDASVLFPVGKEALTPEGHDTIVQVAGVVRKLEQDIPTTLHWVLQVNGHTDVQKIGRGAKFKSNWELSTARALSVVELLLDEQVQGEHVAAAGFGEFQPIDPAPTQEAYAKNRRIELKLTDEGPADGVVMRSDGTPCPAT
jgi:chemotaxis protein MotB